MRHFIFFFSVALLGVGCSDDNPPDPVQVIETSPHFPLYSGQILDYEVYSLTFSNGGRTVDTTKIFIREEITERVERNDGGVFYTVERSRSASPEGPWNYEATWSAVITDNEAVRTEGNRSHVKLVFPARRGVEWNAQKYFDTDQLTVVGAETMDFYKEWNSKYEDVNARITIDGTVYNETHVVNLADYENRLELRYAREYYSRDIGLVYKEVRVLDTQCFSGCEQLSWEQKAERGIIWIQKLIRHE